MSLEWEALNCETWERAQTLRPSAPGAAAQTLPVNEASPTLPESLGGSGFSEASAALELALHRGATSPPSL